MTAIDGAIMAVIMFSMLLGGWRGLIQEISALCSWALAIWTGWRFSPVLALLLPDEIANPSIKIIIAYSLLVASVFMVGSIPRYFLSLWVKKAGFTCLDQVAGMLLGIGRGIVIVGIFVISANLTAMTEQTAWQASRFIPAFQSLLLQLREKIQPEKAIL